MRSSNITNIHSGSVVYLETHKVGRKTNSWRDIWPISHYRTRLPVVLIENKRVFE